MTPRTTTSVLAGFALALCLATPLLAQAPRPRPQPIVSPEIHADRTVTFRFRAPAATVVELSGQFLKANQPMTVDAAGVWSVTVGPVAPNLYPYNFVVNGVSVADPGNMRVFPNERFKASLLDVPADPPALYAVRDVPHGEVTHAYYTSKTLGGTRPLVIYTPPGYREGTAAYPVFYLVSGTTDTEETWFTVGRVNFMLDTLIAEKRAVPMIVVMPYGNVFASTPDPSTLQAAEMYKAFSDDLIASIMPFVDAHYRTRKTRESRAIAGFSRGGGQSLFAGFTNLDRFAWIGSYSAYLTSEVWDKYFAALSADHATTNRRLKLLWLGVGNEDFLFPQANAFDALMTEKQIVHKRLVTGGGHTWMNARTYLAETLQLFFK
jgi:enterochelin esterase family protein